MHVRHVLGLLALLTAAPVAVAACAGPVDSTPDEGADEASATPSEPEPIGEVAQALVCECSVTNDWCATIYGSGHCAIGFTACTKTPKYGCGTLGLYPCTGWCVRP